MGYTVPPPAFTPQEAVTLVQAIHPDVVLMDIGLGGAVDGLKMGQDIQAWEGVPVIYLSGYRPEDLAWRTGGAVPRFYLQKPVTPEVLAQVVAEALGSESLE